MTNNTVRHEERAPYNAAKVSPTTMPEGVDVIEYAKDLLLDRLRARRVADVEPMTAPKIVTDYLQLQMGEYKSEAFAVLFLDNNHRLLRFEEMFNGTLNAASVYPREVAKRALELNAGAVILAHNHPSGLTEPSQADRAITNRLVSALGLFEIRVLDHIIVGEGTFSFAEEGYL